MKSVAMQEQVKYCMSLFRNMTKKYQKRAKNSQKTALHETLKTNSTLLKVQSQDFFWWFWSTCIWNQYLCSKKEKILCARVQMCPIMPKKRPKMVKKFSSWSFEKQKAPSHRSSPKIFFVNSEEHACEISSYAVKSKIFFVLDWKYTQKMLKKGQKRSKNTWKTKSTF